ncbi:hypothetical protein L6452_33357 [Arctium lappa]|uniref:Uncharacterized protein n=1 Tax=Arctium lappa TaxID=4217 RepID=A0ACB8YG49_ARCLA|nr:hypothetical protein L6452_33357 [Arctium lappa]
MSDAKSWTDFTKGEARHTYIHAAQSKPPNSSPAFASEQNHNEILNSKIYLSQLSDIYADAAVVSVSSLTVGCVTGGHSDHQ